MNDRVVRARTACIYLHVGALVLHKSLSNTCVAKFRQISGQLELISGSSSIDE